MRFINGVLTDEENKGKIVITHTHGEGEFQLKEEVTLSCTELNNIISEYMKRVYYIDDIELALEKQYGKELADKLLTNKAYVDALLECYTDERSAAECSWQEALDRTFYAVNYLSYLNDKDLEER